MVIAIGISDLSQARNPKHVVHVKRIILYPGLPGKDLSHPSPDIALIEVTGNLFNPSLGTNSAALPDQEQVLDVNVQFTREVAISTGIDVYDKPNKLSKAIDLSVFVLHF